MDVNHILLGLFVGVMAISLFTPILAVYGFNQTTSMALLYTLPAVGAFTAAVLDSFGRNKIKHDQEEEIISIEKIPKEPKLLGKKVLIESHSGIYQGIVEIEDEKMISLGNSLRIDLPEPSSLDHVFIERNSIKKIEILPPGKNGSESAVCPSGSGSSEIGQVG